MSNVKVAKLFRNGGSQAVRLPAEFRFEGDEVYARRDEKTDDVILSKKTSKTRKEFWADLFAALDAGKTLDADFDAYIAERPMNTPVRDRDIFGDDTHDALKEELDELGKVMDANAPAGARSGPDPDFSRRSGGASVWVVPVASRPLFARAGACLP